MLQQRLLGRHLTAARIATGQTPDDGFDDMIAVVLELLQVVLQDGILPHTCIHGWREEHRGFRSHNRRGKHVIADTGSHLADDVGRTGSH